MFDVTHNIWLGKRRQPNVSEDLRIGRAQSSPAFLLLSSSLWHLVRLHERHQGGPRGFSVVPSSSSVPLISSLCLSASLCPLVSSCFVPSVNKHRDICISGAVFSVDVCISNSLCGLTCFRQRRWHRFNPLTPTISHPGSTPLYQSDEQPSFSARKINSLMISAPLRKEDMTHHFIQFKFRPHYLVCVFPLSR